MTNVVKGVMQPTKSAYEWKLERFLADCEKVGDSYKSPFFYVLLSGEIATKWYLQIYPRGLNEREEDYISIWLFFPEGDTRELTVSFTITIVNDQNNSFTTSKIISKFNDPSLGSGIRLDKSILDDFGALNNDSLTIVCEMLTRESDHVVEETLCGHHSTIIGKGLDDYEELFESASFADVTFNIQEQKIHLHKAILSLRSPVFKAMFENDMKEQKQSSVDITNFDYPVMRELFRFIYAERVKDIENIAKDLLVAAHYYSITELKAFCENILYRKLTVQNAVEYLKLTEIVNSIPFKLAGIDFAAKNYHQIKKQSGYKDLSVETVRLILEAVTGNQ